MITTSYHTHTIDSIPFTATVPDSLQVSLENQQTLEFINLWAAIFL